MEKREACITAEQHAYLVEAGAKLGGKLGDSIRAALSEIARLGALVPESSAPVLVEALPVEPEPVPTRRTRKRKA